MIVCTGPESSGTRLLHRIVSTSGLQCVHRSMPHANDWNLGLREGHEVIVIVRERAAACRSAVAVGHAPTIERAQRRYDLAVGLLDEQIAAAGVPWLWLNYDELLRHPDPVLDLIADFVGAPVKVDEPLRIARRPR